MLGVDHTFSPKGLKSIYKEKKAGGKGAMVPFGGMMTIIIIYCTEIHILIYTYRQEGRCIKGNKTEYVHV